MNKLASKIASLTLDKVESFLKKKKFTILHNLKLYLDDLYYNAGNSPLDDSRYDILKNVIKAKNLSYVPEIGAKLRKGENRVQLPYWLGSADKITPEQPKLFTRWQSDNPSRYYLISEKLDGVSCLLIWKNGEIKLFTRGDGKIGADISYLSGYFKNLPNKLSNSLQIAIRGELIMKKEKFSQTVGYRNSRNMVAGLIGAKTARQGLENVDFVAYEIVGDSMPAPSKQLIKLEKLGFAVVKYKKIGQIDLEILSQIYLQFHNESLYEIDGLIVQADQPYDRNTSGNPDYMFAFKMTIGDTSHETTVKKVEWNISKWGQIKPVVIVEPVKLEGSTIRRATAHNAKYVLDNKLGPGAIIRVTRSKEVIPYIIEIVHPAKTAQLPSIPYLWDKNRVNIISTETENIVCIKLLASFFAKLGIKHVSKKTVEKMFNNGLDNLFKILAADKDRLLQIEEFKEKSAQRIYNNIHKGFLNVKISTILGASGVFGYSIGRKKIDALLLDIPDLLQLTETKSEKEIQDLIVNVEGFSNLTAKRIVQNLPFAVMLVEKLKPHITFRKEKRISNSMKSCKYVMTGFRDKNLEEEIAARGGKITSSVSKNTSAVITAVKGERLTGKLKKAAELEIPIYTKEEFIERFIV